jgi:hypothetical protein
MKKQYALPFLAACALIVSVAMKKGTPAPVQYAETITAADLRTHLEVLASDAYEGRETGEKGQKMAAQYIASFFSKTGIPAQKDGTWFQEVNLVKISGGTSQFIACDSAAVCIEFDAKDDYFFSSATPAIKITPKEFVFVGYGIDDAAYSDYTLHDSTYYKDKVLVMLDGEPVNNGTYRITGTTRPGKWTTQRRAKLNAAKRYNAQAILIVPQDFNKSRELAQHSVEGYSLILDEPAQIAAHTDSPTPVIYAEDSLVNSLFFLQTGISKNHVAEMRQSINTTGKTVNAKLNVSGSITITRREEKLVTENVLGYVEGSDPRLKEEVIVITAHYDHLGKHDGVVFNGADDDGSGTVAVMELAEAFMKAKQDGNGPKRSLLFMTVSGEEKGLLGSSWYTRHPVYPLEKTMCDLNIDMIGRVDEEHAQDSNFVYVIGADKISPDLKKSIEVSNSKYCNLKLDYRYDDEKDPNMFYYRSDHYNFAKNGIPVAFFFNGVHADYHKETDEVSKINYSLMQKRTRLVFYTAWDLANRKKPLAHKAVKK